MIWSLTPVLASPSLTSRCTWSHGLSPNQTQPKTSPDTKRKTSNRRKQHNWLQTLNNLTTVTPLLLLLLPLLLSLLLLFLLLLIFFLGQHRRKINWLPSQSVGGDTSHLWWKRFLPTVFLLLSAKANNEIIKYSLELNLTGHSLDTH